MEAGEDLNKDLEDWENLFTEFTISYILRSAAFMIYDDQYDTQEDSCTIEKQKNPRKGRSGPLTDDIFLEGISLIEDVMVR